MGQPQDPLEWEADQGSPRAAGGTLQELASEPDRERRSVFRQRWKVEEKECQVRMEAGARAKKSESGGQGLSK